MYLCVTTLFGGGTNEPAPIEQEIESPGKPAGNTTSTPENTTLPKISTGEFFSRYNQLFSSRDYDTLLYKTLDPDDFSLEREGEASGTKIYTSCRYIAIGEIERPVRNTEIALTVDQNGAVVCILSRFGPADEITIEWFSITDWCMLLEAMGVYEEPLEALELTTQIMDEGVFEDGRYRLRVAQNAEVSISISDEGEYILSIIVL